MVSEALLHWSLPCCTIWVAVSTHCTHLVNHTACTLPVVVAVVLYACLFAITPPYFPDRGERYT